jgi:hypothetical protein
VGHTQNFECTKQTSIQPDHHPIIIVVIFIVIEFIVIEFIVIVTPSY